MLEWGTPSSTDEGPGQLECDTESIGKEWNILEELYLWGSHKSWTTLNMELAGFSETVTIYRTM